MHWILQDNLFDEAAYQTLLDTLVRFNLPYSIHKVVPMIGGVVEGIEAAPGEYLGGELIPEPELNHKNVICMGSYSMRHQAKKKIWTPGVFDLEPQTFEVQREKWGRHMLNYFSVVTRFEDAKFPFYSICSTHLEGDADCERCKAGNFAELAFIRPIADSKVFAGAVFERQDFIDWQYKVCELGEDIGTSLTNDTLIQVAEPQVIHAEYRCWVVHGQIVTASLYKRGDRVYYSDEVDQEVLDYAQARVDEWQPHAAFCIDVCQTPNGMKVVEIGTLNSCGFYAANIPKLVMALEDGFSR